MTPTTPQEVLDILRLAVPRMATVASIWGVPEDIDAFLKMLRLQEKLTKESK